jgi:hypothetical protein
MKRWVTVSLALLAALGGAPAWANDEMHPGGRLFYPLWDVSTSSRVTFIIVTRLPLNEDNPITAFVSGTGFHAPTQWTNKDKFDNCRPRGIGAFDSSGTGNVTDVNRTDKGGTAGDPVFVDDVHIEYYGTSCNSANETIHMSCADIDLLFLSSTSPRKGFQGVAAEGRGAVDIHLVVNGGGANRRKLENSLLGHAIISDLAEGWAATYPAASTKATACSVCNTVDGGTQVGYEPFPQEVYLPFAFADGFANAGNLTNLLSLWTPGFMPAGEVGRTNLDIRWWDGRERPFSASGSQHALVQTLRELSSGQFSVSNFTCGHASDPSIAENDGFPRTGSSAITCDGVDQPDPVDKSDNFETGTGVQSSTPIGWWRFNRVPTRPAPTDSFGGSFDGKGLVGVVLTSAAPTGTSAGIADATRLWHKEACERGTDASVPSFGPPHLRDRTVADNSIVFFNTFGATTQAGLCGKGF